jgi:hypothetical protein
MTTKLPKVMAAGAALSLLLVACGDDPDPATAPAMQPPVPVRVVAGSGGGNDGDETRLAAAESTAADSSFMPYFGGFTFEVGEDLPALPTNDVGYQFVPDAGVDAATVEALAAALGVGGDAVEGGGADVDGTLWRVGPDDGSAPSLTVSDDAQLSWYYSSAWVGAEGRATASCEAAVDEDGNVTSEICDEPEPPAGVPDAAAAETRVTDLLTAMGEDPEAYTFETYADEWFASVNAWTELGGIRSPMAWGFGFGGEGVLQYANGLLADPVATGPYPLVDLDGALTRLAEQSQWVGDVARLDADIATSSDSSEGSSEGAGVTGSAGSGGVDAAQPPSSAVEAPTTDPGVAPSTEPPSPETVPGDTVASGSTPIESVPVETVPVETVPVEVPEPEVAVLVDVRADFWWSWDEDGSIWLLPAYTFTDTEGRTHTVAAVTDEYLILVEPPMPVDPMPEPAPAPDVPPTSSPQPAVDPVPPTELDTSGIVGLTVDEATKLLAERGLTVRVAREDGEDLAVTMDFVDTRVNVATEAGVITEVLSVG